MIFGVHMNGQHFRNLGTIGLCLLLAVAGIGAFQKKAPPLLLEFRAENFPFIVYKLIRPKSPSASMRLGEMKILLSFCPF